MKFTKMHGAGNDYIYFNCIDESPDKPEELAVKLSDRHFGVGGDGIVLILPSASCDFRMRMFNADGSEGKMCGNASRCIGKYVYEKGLTDKTELTLETLGGVKKLTLNVKKGKVGSVSVDMGRAVFENELIPVIASAKETVKSKLTVDSREWEITCVSVGNPHCVIFTDNIDLLDLTKTGPLFENNSMFPERINTEFIEVIDGTHLRMRVWERGSGETLACGTGACASVAAAVKNGICPPDTFVELSLRGGCLNVMCCSDGTLIMNGPAEFVFEGELTDV